ncbi:Hypothetical protein FKW44_021909 [Caligus rogercresseyi]|uniref:Uncharacterized protein n=1 Tax=Caligus rogercresseyi TaxID=217165 RepID=A0A7T8JVN3_CALRO|nr:Hypothetical protein FKW44_021909 [Caligus rogercresseyi]
MREELSLSINEDESKSFLLRLHPAFSYMNIRRLKDEPIRGKDGNIFLHPAISPTIELPRRNKPLIRRRSSLGDVNTMT